MIRVWFKLSTNLLKIVKKIKEKMSQALKNKLGNSSNSRSEEKVMTKIFR